MDRFNASIAAVVVLALGLIGFDVYRAQAAQAGAVTSEVCNEPLTVTATLTAISSTVWMAQIPLAGTVRLYRNGLRMTPFTDYNLTGRAITFTVPLSGDDILLADYKF